MAKSTVNKAGNYTQPTKRKAIFNRIKAQASHGTAAGKWSARKAQALAKAYKKDDKKEEKKDDKKEEKKDDKKEEKPAASQLEG